MNKFKGTWQDIIDGKAAGITLETKRYNYGRIAMHTLRLPRDVTLGKLWQMLDDPVFFDEIRIVRY